MPRCMHTSHIRSTEIYKTGSKDIKISVILGYSYNLRKYQLCDEGFIPNSAKLKKLTTEEV